MSSDTGGRPAGEDLRTVTYALLRGWLLPNDGTSKESRGRTLVVGGSAMTPGAVLLAGEAAMRAGAGKLQVAAPASSAPHLALALPEALVLPMPENEDGTLDPAGAERAAELAADAAAVLIGPGMVGTEQTLELLRGLIPAVRGSLVLDALGLAIAGDAPELLRARSGPTILTPNLTELAICLHEEEGSLDDDVVPAVRRLAERTGAAVTSGASESFTSAATGPVWHDLAGGRGLGVSGSGDVLAGAVAGLAARGAGPEQAAVWGVHLHRRAGDRLAAEVGRTGVPGPRAAGPVPPGALRDRGLAGPPPAAAGVSGVGRYDVTSGVAGVLAGLLGQEALELGAQLVGAGQPAVLEECGVGARRDEGVVLPLDPGDHLADLRALARLGGGP